MADRPMGPAEPHSTVLSIEQEAVIVAFRRYTLLPLDDCLYTLQVEPLSAIGSRTMARDSGFDPLLAASVPAAPRHFPAAGYGR